MKRSLRVRLMLGATALALLFMLSLLPLLSSTLRTSLEAVIEQRLASDASGLIAAARSEQGHLVMPTQMPSEEFNLIESKLLGFIYDRDGTLLWRSTSSEDERIDYRPRYEGGGHDFGRVKDASGREFYVYDLELGLLRDQPAAYSIITMQPVSEYRRLFAKARQQLYLSLGGSLLLLLVLLWLGLTWGFRALRSVSYELDEVESGQRETLSQQHPRELLRLIGSLNRLLDSERRQRERYRHSLGDLAHSLKTPLTVLQGLAEQSPDAAQRRVLSDQVERMNQQVSYQLQRASLRRSGLVRHSYPLKEVLDTLCGALDKVYRDKGVKVQSVFAQQLRVPMEQAALFEVLGNILENAYRLCAGQIRVSAQTTGTHCELIVEDDGPGIPEPQRERILQRGERFDDQHPGQGIGTAVVLDIVDSYAGRLQLRDSELGGIAFVISLPER